MIAIDPTLIEASPTEASESHYVSVALAHLIASAEPAVVFSRLADLSVSVFSDACTVDIVEEEQAAYRISCPRADPDVAPVL